MRRGKQEYMEPANYFPGLTHNCCLGISGLSELRELSLSVLTQ